MHSSFHLTMRLFQALFYTTSINDASFSKPFIHRELRTEKAPICWRHNHRCHTLMKAFQRHFSVKKLQSLKQRHVKPQNSEKWKTSQALVYQRKINIRKCCVLGLTHESDVDDYTSQSLRWKISLRLWSSSRYEFFSKQAYENAFARHVNTFEAKGRKMFRRLQLCSPRSIPRAVLFNFPAWCGFVVTWSVE